MLCGAVTKCKGRRGARISSPFGHRHRHHRVKWARRTRGTLFVCLQKYLSLTGISTLFLTCVLWTRHVTTRPKLFKNATQDVRMWKKLATCRQARRNSHPSGGRKKGEFGFGSTADITCVSSEVPLHSRSQEKEKSSL